MAKNETNYKEYAISISNWMREMGFIYDDKKHTIRTIPAEEILKEFRIKLDENDEPTMDSYNEWQHIKLSMIQLGIPIAVREFKGHYLGEDGDQFTSIARNINYGISIIQRGKIQMEAVISSGKGDIVYKKLNGRISKNKLKGMVEDVNQQLFLLQDAKVV